jgi:hypothetical protein
LFLLFFFLSFLHVEDTMRMSHLFTGIIDFFLLLFLRFFYRSFSDFFFFFFFFVLRLIYVLWYGSVSSTLFFIFFFCYDAASVESKKKQFIVVRHRWDINMCGMNEWMKERSIGHMGTIWKECLSSFLLVLMRVP